MPPKKLKWKGNYYLSPNIVVYLSIKETEENNSKNDTDTVMVLLYHEAPFSIKLLETWKIYIFYLPNKIYLFMNFDINSCNTFVVIATNL